MKYEHENISNLSLTDKDFLRVLQVDEIMILGGPSSLLSS